MVDLPTGRLAQGKTNYASVLQQKYGTHEFDVDNAGVAELVDARDLKSLGPQAHAGSSPASGTI